MIIFGNDILFTKEDSIIKGNDFKLEEIPQLDLEIEMMMEYEEIVLW